MSDLPPQVAVHDHVRGRRHDHELLHVHRAAGQQRGHRIGEMFVELETAELMPRLGDTPMIGIVADTVEETAVQEMIEIVIVADRLQGDGIEFIDLRRAALRQLILAIGELVEARRERTNARSQVTRISNQLIKLKSASSSSIPTIPAYHNPGGPLVILQPPTHPGPSAGTLIASPPSTAYIADLHKEQRSATIESDVRNYTKMANQYIQSLPSKQLVCVSSDRKTTGSIGYNAGKIAGKERDLANTASPGTYASSQVVGHVPDTAATGLSYSPLGWFQQNKTANSIVGGGLYAGRVITVYLVKEQNGKVYQY